MLMKISKDNAKNISDKYLSGISSTKLAKEYNVDGNTILNTLKRNSITIRAPKDNRKYPVVENYFDNIDNQEKAYFLGFLFADGCNLGKRVSLNLSEKDLDMLKKLNFLIHPQGKPLYRSEKRDSIFKHSGNIAHTKTNYHLIIENKHIAEVLSSYGCVPRKTNVLKFPSNLKSEFISHFIRGYFDGDGSVSLYGEREFRINAYVSITSTRSFCENIQLLTQNMKIESVILEKNYETNNVVELRIRKIESVISFLNWIYKDSSIHLNRKYFRYCELIKNRKYYKEHPAEELKCCVCNEPHYGKGYCNRHYQFYVRKVVALLRTKKSLFEFLILSNKEKPEEYIINIIKDPPNYNIPYRTRSKKG